MSSATRAFSAIWVLGGEILGMLMQLAMIYAGITFLFIVDESVDDEIGRLLLWCAIGTIYVLVTVLWLNIDLRIHRDDHPLVGRLVDGSWVRVLSTVFTFLASIMGLTAAVTLILMHGDPDHLVVYELAAVWAMLVSWAIFHWGYARIYHAKYYRAPGGLSAATPALIFPGTDTPRLIDFVYFSFTIGTSFAPSDVAVSTSRMRWTVVWHTVFSFFFNALIIVLTMNTISGGF